MIACILGLTACGEEEDWVTQADLSKNVDQMTYEQQKLQVAMWEAENQLVPLLASFADPEMEGYLDDLTMEEIAYSVNYTYNMEVDGYAFYSAVSSFRSAIGDVGGVLDAMGALRKSGETTAKVDGNQIIVHVEVSGEKKNATAEVIFSNDQFLVMESAALNPESTLGELMTGAALNTLIGMGVVFSVLILISFIISCFRVIPAIQKKAADRKENKREAMQSASVDNAVAQIVGREEISGEDDLELAAVIAAAIAAYEGAASTDGYVVRSILRRR